MAHFELGGKVALITGGARGIGLATAKSLAARGAAVLIADLDEAAVRAAAADVHDTRALGIVADVTDRGAMQRAVVGAVERFRGLDAVVANAGIIDPEMVHRAIDAAPLADRMLQSLPRPLRKRVSPAVAAEAIAQGIERRSPRIIRPRRWVVMSLLRGLLNPLSDARLERDEQAQSLLRAVDARAGEDQPTTA